MGSWSVFSLRLIRNGSVVQSAGYYGQSGNGSYSTGWDKTCGCNNNWYAEAFDLNLNTSGLSAYRYHLASGYYAT